ncbi:hypothetical protein LWI28_011298 [Acer negundo]|uniref:Protein DETOXIFICATION n=1 Tax=Acer negundo TaxID=4023 RepID=A0AAD5JHB2_ACENE|nr:hypothetical protein LWI28_011298 [Acer negundo]
MREEENTLLLSTPKQREDHQEEEEEEEEVDNLLCKIWKESKKLWEIAGPSIFSRLAMFLMTVVTQAFAGHLSDLDLAAISIVTTVIISISFGLLLGMASALESRDIVWPSLWSQTVPFVRHIHATFMDCFIHMFDFVNSHVCFCVSNIEAHWTANFSGRADRCCCFVVDTISFELLVSIPFAKAFTGIWEFFKLSVASGVMLLLENFYYRILIIVAGYKHNTKVAVDALSICITIYAWESMISHGFFAATSFVTGRKVRVANELGAGNANGAKFATIVSVIHSLLIGLLFWSIIIAIPEKPAMIFISSAAVITMVNELAVLLAFTILLNCIQPVLSGVAVGSGWQALVAYINIGSYYIVGVPLGVLLGWLLKYNIRGIWAGMISGTMVQT